MTRFSRLLAAVPNLIAAPDADPSITAPVVEDSRAVAPGGVFVAREGLAVDGHAYIRAAVERGAAAVVGERTPDQVDCPAPYAQVQDAGLALAHLAAAYHGFPARRLVMIGVTGTDGKTTTANLIHSILTAAGLRAGLISTINAVIGNDVLDTGLHVTTPTAPQVQGYLAAMVDAGLTHCVLEATSHGLAQHRIAACDFDVAVVTNVQHEHLDFHGDFDAYLDAKATLFRYLLEGAEKPGVTKTAVINLDDEASAGKLLGIPAERQLTYAVNDPSADVRAGDVIYQPDSTAFDVRLPGGVVIPIRTALVGAFNVSNVLAAVAAAHGLSAPAQAIREGVRAVEAIPGRMERIDEGQDFLAVVDFAHTPNALRRALEAARTMTLPEKRIIAVFGSAGLRDPAKRAMMGRIAAELADRVVITAEDPRTEPLHVIINEIAEAVEAAGGVEGKTYWRVPDRGEAIHFATGLASRGDIVLAFGKGHEQSMCFGTTEYPWDDRTAMRSALRREPLRGLPTASDPE
jgi:UDP-N-acetylmuramoyl-L-alanyl-D-glutamate--2,6-diaminopimelate ligase